MTNVQKLGLLILIFFLLTKGRTGGEPSPLKDFPGSYVLVVDSFDDRAKLPKDQFSILTSVTLAKWLDANVTAWRKLDATKDDGAGDAAWVAASMGRAKGKPLPWMGVYGKRWHEGPLEANLTAFEHRVFTVVKK